MGLRRPNGGFVDGQIETMGNPMSRKNSKKKSKASSPRGLKIIVERHADGYVAYPLGLKGVVVGAGDTYDAAMADVKSAIRFHIETFGTQVLDVDSPVLEAFVAEAEVAT